MEDSELFNLSQIIAHHKNSVRSIAVNSKGVLATASFDRTCCIWNLIDSKYILHRETKYHDEYIYIVRAAINDIGFFTGSKDKKIVLMDNDGNPLAEFLGHTQTINSISQIDGTYFVSGSWDGSAKVWDLNTNSLSFTLGDHTHAVAVLALKGKRFVTASQDKRIRLWDKEVNFKTINNAHEDIIRDIKQLGESFITCSNDCLIKQWTFEGVLLNTIAAHESFIFTILPVGDWIFSGGDDRFLKVFKYSQETQALIHPNTIWDLAVTRDLKVITACGDGIIRIFSSEPSQWLNAEELQEYEKFCFEALQSSKEGNSGDKVDLKTLPLVSEISRLKGKEGEIRIFNNNGVAEAYVYKSSLNTWQMMGEVLGTKNDKKYYEGDKAFPAGEYDFVFDVEMDGRTMKLPFNKGGNALVAAERLMTREGLHRLNLDDITKFLRANGKDSGYTQTAAKKDIPKKIYQCEKVKFPTITIIKYDNVSIDGPLKKILEVNEKLDKESQHYLNESDLKSIKLILETIKKSQFYHTSVFNEPDLLVFNRKFGHWSEEHIIPYLDCFRMYLIHPKSNELFKKIGGGYQEYTRFLELLKSTSNDVIRILVVRILSNFFMNESSRLLVLDRRQEILDLVSNFIDSENKNLRSSIIGLLFNYTIHLFDKKDGESGMQLISLLNEMMINEKEGKNLRIILVGFGNLVFSNENNRNIFKDMEVVENIKTVKCTNFEENDKAVFNEVKVFLSQIIL